MAEIYKFPVKANNQMESKEFIDYDKIYEEYYAEEEKFYLENGYYRHNSPDESEYIKNLISKLNRGY